MVCLGSAQMQPSPLESEAAQLRIVQLFRTNFLSRYPDGVVISELEYMGRTTSAPNNPGPLQFPGKPALSRVMDALSQDFRKWVKNRDYRKCDALGIARDGTVGELVEVTTEQNAVSAITQVTAKVMILRETVNRIHLMSTDWMPSLWKPGATQLFFPLPSNPREVKYLCYAPTFRAFAPPGVVLYEVHVIRRIPVPENVRVPSEAADKIRESYRNKKANESEEAWASRFGREHPVIIQVLKGLAVVAGIALAIAALILVFDPVPGDEAAAGAAAAALMKFATSG